MAEPTEKGHHPSQYLNDLEEWGEHQYSPGHWTGGKIPPCYKYARRPVIMVILLIGLYTVISSLAVLVTSARNSSNLLPGGLALLTGGVLVAGSLARLRRKQNYHRKSKRNHHQ